MATAAATLTFRLWARPHWGMRKLCTSGKSLETMADAFVAQDQGAVLGDLAFGQQGPVFRFQAVHRQTLGFQMGMALSEGLKKMGGDVLEGPHRW
jgi:hypothetical protein